MEYITVAQAAERFGRLISEGPVLQYLEFKCPDGSTWFPVFDSSWNLVGYCRRVS